MSAFFDLLDSAPELPFYGVLGGILVAIGLCDRVFRSRWSR